MSFIEVAASFIGLAAVILTIRQNILCWPVGLVQVCLFIIVFYRAQLYSNMLLYISYIFIQIYGWYHWSREGKKARQLPVTTTSRTLVGTYIIFIALGTIAWGHFMDNETKAAVPYPDAFIMVASLVAQWLMARKKLENWVLWLIIDLIALPLYLHRQLYWTTALYVILLILSGYGWFTWRRQMREPRPTEAG